MVRFLCWRSIFRAKAENDYSANDPENVDNYHYISQDPQAGVAGIARTIRYSSWTYGGSVCWPQKHIRTAITEVYGPETASWNQLRLGTAEVSIQY